MYYVGNSQSLTTQVCKRIPSLVQQNTEDFLELVNIKFSVFFFNDLHNFFMAKFSFLFIFLNTLFFGDLKKPKKKNQKTTTTTKNQHITLQAPHSRFYNSAVNYLWSLMEKEKNKK